MFSQVSVCLKEGGVHPRQVDTPSGMQTPTRLAGRHPPPGWPKVHWAETPKQTVTAADGTHPTGMHSCPLVSVVLEVPVD